MESRWIEDINEFDKIKEDWDLGLELSKADNPFLLSDFIITWWEFLGKNHRLEIFVLFDNNEILAGFPLYIKKFAFNKGFLSCLCQIGDSFANINEPFYRIDKKAFTRIFFQAVSYIKNWDYMHFINIKNKFLTYEVKSKTNNDTFFHCISDLNELNPLIEVQEEVDLMVKKYGKKLRRNINYYRKKLEQNGPVQLVEYDELSKIEDLCNQYIQFSKESRKKRGKLSSYENYDFEKCSIEIIKRFAVKGRVFAHLLKNDSEIIAIAFGYKYGTSYKWIFTSYNPNYELSSPGYTLIYELINYVYEKKLNYIDLYSGGEVFYKKQWANKFLPLIDLKIFNNNLLGIIIYYLYRMRRSFKSSTNKMLDLINGGIIDL